MTPSFKIPPPTFRLLYPGVILMFLVFNVLPLTAQLKPYKSSLPDIDSMLDIRGEAYIAISLSKHKSAPALARDVSLDMIRNDTAFFYITARDTGFLNSSGIAYHILTPPSLKAPAVMAQSIPDVLEGKAYPTLSQYLEIMGIFQDTYPGIVVVDTIGYSIDNKLILAARITIGSLPSESRPVVHLSSTIHGDEPVGYVVLLMLMHELMQESVSPGHFRDIMEQVVLIINPLSNPDGTYFVNENTVTGSRRTNRNNIDLNRNFPDPYAGPLPYGNPRQKENQLMMNYLLKYPPSISANIHGGAEVVNYPWDWRENPNPSDDTPNPHPDNNWFYFISKEYADTARLGHPGYMSAFPPWGITNGAAWYPIYGGRQDYVTAFVRGRELTLEISDEKIPAASQLSYYYERNRNSLINLIKQATFGIHGTVRDEETGMPLEARLNLSGHDAGFSYVLSDSTTGVFHRYAKAGSYDLVFEKQGYIRKNIPITVSDYERTDLSIHLRKNNNPTLLTDLHCYPNPFTGEFRVEFYVESPGKCVAELFTHTGKLVYSTVYDALEGDNTLFFTHIPAGLFILKISTPDRKMVKRVLGW